MDNIIKASADMISKMFIKRDPDSHKGDFGYVGIFGGSIQYSGATKLANLACASLRAGAGVARLIVPSSIASAVMPYLVESTLYPIEDNGIGSFVFDKQSIENAISGLKSVCFGMGAKNTRSVFEIAKHLLNKKGLNLILDADALNSIAENEVSILSNPIANTIITPHLKEFSRLTQIDINEIKSKAPEIAFNYAKQNNIVVLLKGSTTYITNGKSIYSVDRGCVGMAKGGSGDVLSGVLAGICGYTNDTILAGVCASFICGVAGELATKDLGEYSALPSDTIKYIGKAIQYINKES